jgi:hypothetical protein
VELALRVAHVQLDEGSGQLLRLPRRGYFAGPEANDDVAGTNSLAGFQRQALRDAVALVE